MTCPRSHRTACGWGLKLLPRPRKASFPPVGHSAEARDGWASAWLPAHTRPEMKVLLTRFAFFTKCQVTGEKLASLHTYLRLFSDAVHTCAHAQRRGTRVLPRRGRCHGGLAADLDGTGH